MKAKVVSGDVFDVKGPIVARTPTYYIDFHFENAGTTYSHVIPKGWNSMVVVHSGSIKVQGADTEYQAINTIVF